MDNRRPGVLKESRLAKDSILCDGGVVVVKRIKEDTARRLL